jgi:hypothetical protein
MSNRHGDESNSGSELGGFRHAQSIEPGALDDDPPANDSKGRPTHRAEHAEGKGLTGGIDEFEANG